MSHKTRLRRVAALLPVFLAACGAPADVGEGLDADSQPALGTLSSAMFDGESESDGPLEITLVAPPHPVRTTDEQFHLVYELVVQNTADAPVRLSRLDVFEPGRRTPLARHAGDALAQVLLGASIEDGTVSIAPGAGAVAFLDIAVPSHRALPHSLRHHFVREGARRFTTASGPTVPVARERAIRLGPPLGGDSLVDLNGCCDGAHNRALLGIDGELFLAQRFAIDFVRAENESTFAGDPSRNDSYFLYGAPVLAVTTGRVVAIHDGVAENVPTQPLPPGDIETAAGNYVIEALEGGQFALYAHLQPGSIRVRPGQRVRRGQVLGLVGNSGNSTEPHLHFHVMDRPSALASNGLPYVFDRFRLQGIVDVTGPEPAIIEVPPPQERRNRLPLDLDVIAFP